MSKNIGKKLKIKKKNIKKKYNKNQLYLKLHQEMIIH